MSCRRWSFAAALVAAAVCSPSFVAGEDELSATSSDAATKVRTVKDVEFALSGKADVQIIQMPLYQFASDCEQKLGVDVDVDKRALIDAGIDPDAIEITIDLRGITYASALHHILRPLDLAYVVGDGVLEITTIEKANGALETRVYPAFDLVAFHDDSGTVRHDERLLREVIPDIIAPGSWGTYGGAGSISVRDGLLAVTQSRTGHEQVSAFLAVVRNAKQAPADDSNEEHVAKKMAMPATGDRVVEEALEKTVSGFQFLQMPIGQVAELLEQQLKVNVHIDKRALTDAGMEVDSLEFLLDYSPTRVRSALARMLPQYDLAAVVDREVVLITTRELAESMPKLAAYDISDLLSTDGDATQADSGRKLGQLIVSAVDRAAWNEVGGQNCLKFVARWNLLVVSAPASTQRKIVDTLDKLRDAKRQQEESDPAPGAAVGNDDPIELRVFAIASITDGDNETATKIAELVREFLPEVGDSESSDNRASYVRALPDRLVVRNRRSVLTKVETLLKQLGSPQGPGATAASARP
jgi:hypothetical protein